MIRSIWYNVTVIVSAFETIGVDVKKNVSGATLSTLKCGGNLSFVAYPNDTTQLKNTIEVCKRLSLPYCVVGNGSNTLIKDDGFLGIVVSLKRLNQMEISNHLVSIESGALSPYVANILARENLGGFERLSGIPATIGGMVTKNAGCYGMEIGDIVECVSFLDTSSLKFGKSSRNDIPFAYRSTEKFFKDKIITNVTLNLKPNSFNVKENILAYREKRLISQPSLPSLGSTFKKANGISAGYFLDKAGLKGVKVGGIMVSPKHANFFVNVGNATATDYLKLISLAKDVAYNKFIVLLEKEIDILGDNTIE